MLTHVATIIYVNTQLRSMCYYFSTGEKFQLGLNFM